MSEPVQFAPAWEKRSRSGLDDQALSLAPAQEVLRREVNPNVYPALEFSRKLAAGEPFLKRVLAERKIYIFGGEDDLGQPAAHRKAQGARRR